MRVHDDWRGKIHDTLRQKRVKLTGDYIQRNLDRFNLLLPRLRLGREVVMQRRDISAITGGEWSEASIGKFLGHLTKTGAVEVRNAGSRGLGITLKHDLTESPWRSRRSGTGRVVPEPEGVEEDTESPLQEDVEFEPMPTAPQPVQPQYDVPEDADYSTSLDLDLTLSALDTVAHNLLRVDLSFAKDFSGAPAAKLYEAQEAITLAVRQLGQIRSAIGAGDNSDLEGIVGSSA